MALILFLPLFLTRLHRSVGIACNINSVLLPSCHSNRSLNLEMDHTKYTCADLFSETLPIGFGLDGAVEAIDRKPRWFHVP